VHGGCIRSRQHRRRKRCVFAVQKLAFNVHVCDCCTGYGGAVSVYFGLSSGLQLLYVSFFNLHLQSNVFTNCVVTVSSSRGGNSYGGGVSLYIGGYSSVMSSNAKSTVGGTMVHNASVFVNTAKFLSCSARRVQLQSANVFCGNSFGGSFSFYIGAYAWSSSDGSGSSMSSSGPTTASGLRVVIKKSPCRGCFALTLSSGSFITSNNAFGGSISALHVGAYAWSQAQSAGSSSVCDTTTASGLSVSISNSSCTECISATSSSGISYSAHSSGGSVSALHVGAYAWSQARSAGSSSSVCNSTTASGLSVSIINSPCTDCISSTSSSDISFGAHSSGGSLRVLHVGAYAWSQAQSAGSSISLCDTTTASGLSVSISYAPCINCRASTTSSNSFLAIAFGGSISALHVGAYAWSQAQSAWSSSVCNSTTSSGLSVSIINSPCTDCISSTSSSGLSFGAHSSGGSVSALHVGAYAWSQARSAGSSNSLCDTTTASGLSVSISHAPCINCRASTTSSSSSFLANAFGGSVSALHVGAYAWSQAQSAGSSISLCDTTTASGLSVSISNSSCTECISLTKILSSLSLISKFGAHSSGGSLGVLHVGACAWSQAPSAGSSSSVCNSTTASGLSVSISNSSCTGCISSTISSGMSYYAHSSGGSISALHVGAYAWSSSMSSIGSNSLCEATTANGLSVSISHAPCINCRASTTSSSSYLAIAFGGSISALHVGAYAWSQALSAGSSSSVCNSTTASGLSVRINNSSCTDCISATSSSSGISHCAHSSGGSVSALHVGAYSWSQSLSVGISSSVLSVCDTTTASGLSVSISNSPCTDCISSTSSSGISFGAHSSGGSLRVLLVGAYAWSQALLTGSSSSVCDTTTASGLSVSISYAPCINCRVSTTSSSSYLAIAFGGSISALHVGAYAWSQALSAGSSSSVCNSTTASGLSVSISNSSCTDCISSTSSSDISLGAHSSGGSLRVLNVGDYAWSQAMSGSSSSVCDTTTASGLSVSISNSSCTGCISLTRMLSSSGIPVSQGAHSSGGSVSALHVGAYAWSQARSAGSSSSVCDTTTASGLSVSIINSSCTDCISSTISSGLSFGAHSSGGSVSALHVGAHAWSFSNSSIASSSVCNTTTANGLSVRISHAPCINCRAATISSSSFFTNAFGGMISALFVGSYTWNFNLNGDSSSVCNTTTASDLSVSMSDVRCSICDSSTIITGRSSSANAFGGSLSVLYIGANAWSLSSARDSSSSCKDTTASVLSVTISNSSCHNCTASTSSLLGSYGANAFGGSMSVLYVGAYAWSFSDAFNSAQRFILSSSFTGSAKSGLTSVQNSCIILNSIKFENCSVRSTTLGPTGSLDSASVFGGAVSIVQFSRTFSQQFSPVTNATNTIGSKLSVNIADSIFDQCSAETVSSLVRPGAANAGGGAVYTSSAALSNFTIVASNFSNDEVFVRDGSVGSDSVSSYCMGGAVAVEASGPHLPDVAFSACNFSNCVARGAQIQNLAVRGGAVAVFRAASAVIRNSKFINCNVTDAALFQLQDDVVVSGGAGASLSLVTHVSIENCEFNAVDGEDSSGTSKGLLVLASDTFLSRTNVVNTTFESQTPGAILNVLCVNDAGNRSAACAPLTQFTSVENTNVFQRSSSDDSETHDRMISFRTSVSSFFTNFRMHCSPADVVMRRSREGYDVYECDNCPLFRVSPSASSVFIENLTHASRDGTECIGSPLAYQCPTGMSGCSTFINVTIGFWTSFNDITTFPLNPIRCPPGYCTCGRDSSSGPLLLNTCRLPTPLTIDSNPDPLCAPNRVGRLCGGCRPNFTQSMDGMTCIPNAVCTDNLWWVWTISILCYALYSLYIVVSSGKFGNNLLSHLLLYLQISSFASIPSDSNESSGVFQIMSLASQFRPIVAFVSGVCYGPNMSAYNSTASTLIGPLFVLFLSAVWTRVLRAFETRLHLHNIHIRVSYSGTLASASLFVFSNVASVVFTLVECTQYDSSGVVFVDGTVPCLDRKWTGLMVMIVLLCMFPAVFLVALWRNMLPGNARSVVCRAFTERVFYWPALTLGFRLLISVVQFAQSVNPIVVAFLRTLFSLSMSILLTNLRPHVFDYAYWMDVSCYSCLVLQFSLQTFFAGVGYLAVTVTADQEEFSNSLRRLSLAFRLVCGRVPVHHMQRTFNTNVFHNPSGFSLLSFLSSSG
jgi:hypothetical protein